VLQRQTGGFLWQALQTTARFSSGWAAGAAMQARKFADEAKQGDQWHWMVSQVSGQAAAGGRHLPVSMSKAHIAHGDRVLKHHGSSMDAKPLEPCMCTQHARPLPLSLPMRTQCMGACLLQLSSAHPVCTPPSNRRPPFITKHTHCAFPEQQWQCQQPRLPRSHTPPTHPPTLPMQPRTMCSPLQGHKINPCNSMLHPAVTEAGILPEGKEEVAVQAAYTPKSHCFGCGG
jgi:hypothetical protein